DEKEEEEEEEEEEETEDGKRRRATVVMGRSTKEKGEGSGGEWDGTTRNGGSKRVATHRLNPALSRRENDAAS
ncbi:hypothetical protein V1478_018737, partial [Vespula squamosa]